MPGLLRDLKGGFPDHFVERHRIFRELKLAAVLYWLNGAGEKVRWNHIGEIRRRLCDAQANWRPENLTYRLVRSL